ncbi:hypothetical protein ABIA30_002536 [Mycobacterium sp. MAA66]|uniref:hypothetical protein n=1 Tax=Mycobacterium sp. MAA66 TaxID=3156297 RepID=UPI0035160B17
MQTTRTTAIALAGAALAMAAPASFAAAETAQETINRLQASGYTVTIDRIGTAPMSQCVVTSIRNPQTTTQLVPYVGPGTNNRGNGSFLVPQSNRTVSVSLDCSGGGTAR